MTALLTPSEDGFLANVTLLDDPAFAGLDADALREKVRADFTRSAGADGVFRGFGQ